MGLQSQAGNPAPLVLEGVCASWDMVSFPGGQVGRSAGAIHCVVEWQEEEWGKASCPCCAPLGAFTAVDSVLQ